MRAILCPWFVLTLVALLAGQSMPVAKGPPYKAPAGDLKQEVLWASWLPGNRMLAYDASGNRWVGLKLGGSAPFDVSAGMVYDPKRRLVWLVEGARTAGDVFVLRLDAAKADVQPVADLPMPAPLTRPAKEHE